MKSLILGFCLTAFTLHAADGIELKPLQPFVDEVIAQFSKDTGSEETNLSQMAYVGRRCSVLYALMYEYGKNSHLSDKNGEMKKVAETFMQRSMTCLLVARWMNEKQVHASEEFVEKQLAQLVSTYIRITQDSKVMNNSLFPPFVKADMKAANEIYPYFEALSSKSE